MLERVIYWSLEAFLVGSFLALVALWLATIGDSIAQFHHEGMERVRRFNEREEVRK